MKTAARVTCGNPAPQPLRSLPRRSGPANATSHRACVALGAILIAVGCTESGNSADDATTTKTQADRPIAERAPATDEAVPAGRQVVTDPLVGEWKRITPPYQGMQVRVQKTQHGYAGMVIKKADTNFGSNNFHPGDLKWKHVVKESSRLLTLEDLTFDSLFPYQESHGVLEPGRLTLRSADKTKVGGFQVWEKMNYRRLERRDRTVPDFRGTWSGIYSDANGTQPITLKLTQDGSRLSGSTKLGGTSGTVVGNATDAGFELTMVQQYNAFGYIPAQATSTLHARLKGNRLTGTDSGSSTFGTYLDGRFTLDRK